MTDVALERKVPPPDKVPLMVCVPPWKKSVLPAGMLIALSRVLALALPRVSVTPAGKLMGLLNTTVLFKTRLPPL